MTPGVTAPEFSSSEVCRITGATFRQIDYWCNQGLVGRHVVGRGSGHSRRFTDYDQALVAVLARLVQDRRHGPELFRFVAQEASEMDLSRGWLVLAPGRVRWVGSADELVAAWAGLGAFVVVCLDDVVPAAAKGRLAS